MYYFAYGSNMDIAQMASRCPGATVVGRACLYGHQFSINPRGYATVIKNKRQKVYGLIWDISDENAMALDQFESAPLHYQRKMLTVNQSKHRKEKMLVYVAVKSERGQANAGYIEKIINAAQILEFPAYYRTMLSTFLG